MTNVHEKILEVLRRFMERVHESGRVQYNKLEFLKFCNKSRNVMKSLYISSLPYNKSIKPYRVIFL